MVRVNPVGNDSTSPASIIASSSARLMRRRAAASPSVNTYSERSDGWRGGGDFRACGGAAAASSTRQRGHSASTTDRSERHERTRVAKAAFPNGTCPSRVAKCPIAPNRAVNRCHKKAIGPGDVVRRVRPPDNGVLELGLADCDGQRGAVQRNKATRRFRCAPRNPRARR
jgi:hypothetical protein